MKQIIILLVLFYSVSGFSQERLVPLQSNPVLKALYGKQTYYFHKNARAAKDSDTTNLQLPFRDDFSGQSIYPDQKLWIDSNVFINDNLAIKAPTAGVATFDGVDKHGNAYQPNSGDITGKADSLTSRHINLGGLTPQDSVFLSFYLESTGLGNAPEAEDSMVLQFRAPGRSWTTDTVFTYTGNDTTFRRAERVIRDTAYFKKGFQFRFVNNATLSGNLDHWHLDYVYMNTNAAQKRALNDVAFKHRPTSLLTPYQSLPWSHYVTTMKKPTISIGMVRFFQAGEAGRLYYSPPQSEAIDLKFFGDTILSRPSSLFDIKNDLNKKNIDIPIVFKHDIQNDYTPNDTAGYIQRFSNYFAYDDGTAENGYGVNFNKAKIAQEFTLSHPDTLQAIGIFFTQIITNQSQHTFRLMVWSSLSPENVVYEAPDIEIPRYQGIDSFYVYRLSKPLPMSGTFYIGFQQNTEDIINIGFDRNSDSHGHVFFTTNGPWHSSSLEGNLMMRPYVGSPIPAGISPVADKQRIGISPNPAAGFIDIKLPGSLYDENYRIFTPLGQCLQQGNLTPRIDISALKPGLYLLQVADVKGTHYSERFLIAR